MERLDERMGDFGQALEAVRQRGLASAFKWRELSSRAQSVATGQATSVGRTGCCKRGHSPSPFDHAAAPAHARLVEQLGDGGRLVPLHRFRALARRLDLLVPQPVELDARVCDELDARCKVGHQHEELAEVMARDIKELARARRAHGGGGELPVQHAALAEEGVGVVRLGRDGVHLGDAPG